MMATSSSCFFDCLALFDEGFGLFRGEGRAGGLCKGKWSDGKQESSNGGQTHSVSFLQISGGLFLSLVRRRIGEALSFGVV